MGTHHMHTCIHNTCTHTHTHTHTYTWVFFEVGLNQVVDNVILVDSVHSATTLDMHTENTASNANKTAEGE